MAGIRPGQAKGPWVGTVIDATEVTGGANVGTGTGLVFRDRAGHILNFKTLKQGSNIVITNNADDITIAATVPLTSIANVGTGTGLVWRDTVAGTVNLKSIKQGSNVTITNNANDITIAATVPLTAIANVGTGTGLVWRDTVGGTINLKSIKQGTSITVTNNADDITITNAAPESTTVSNVGTGTGLVYKSMTGTQINLKSIKQGTNVTVTNNTDDITIAATVPLTAIANVGTGTGLVWRDTVAGTINLKSIKQGTGITVTNNADDITIACTITQGPTGSGTINYVAKWTAATVLGDSGIFSSGITNWIVNDAVWACGGSVGVSELEISATNVTPLSQIIARRKLLITGASAIGTSAKISLENGIIILNEALNDIDTKVNGDTIEIFRGDGGDDALKMFGRLTAEGVIDNAGAAYAGGAIGAPVNINLTTKVGNVIRLAPTDETNNYYYLTNPKNWQVVLIHNESLNSAFIFQDVAGIGGVYIHIPPQFGAFGQIGEFALVQFNPSVFNGVGAWVKCSIQRQPISVALVDAATIAVPANYGDCLMTVTLGGNRTLGLPSGTIHDGQKIVFRITQDGTGGRTLGYNAIYRFSTDLPSPTLSTGINKVDYLGFIYNAAANKWDFVGKVFGFN